MKFAVPVGTMLLLLLLLSGPSSQDLGFDLSDALEPDPTPAKPKEQPKAPEKPKSDGDLGFDLGDAVDPPNSGGGGGGAEPKPDKPANKPPKTPGGGGGGGDGFDLGDALGPDPKPKEPKKPVNPPQSGGGGGGGTFDDSDLLDVAGGNYKPEGGRSGNSGNYDPQGGGDQPQEASAGPLAGIISSIGVALLGAASGYFAYQKKKLCFKLRGGQDPESGNGQVRSDPQVYSDLLQNS